MRGSLQNPLLFCGLLAGLVSSAVADKSYRLATTVIGPPTRAIEADTVGVELTLAQSVIGSASASEGYRVQFGFWAATPAASEQIFVDGFEAP